MSDSPLTTTRSASGLVLGGTKRFNKNTMDPSAWRLDLLGNRREIARGQQQPRPDPTGTRVSGSGDDAGAHDCCCPHCGHERTWSPSSSSSPGPFSPPQAISTTISNSNSDEWHFLGEDARSFHGDVSMPYLDSSSVDIVSDRSSHIGDDGDLNENSSSGGEIPGVSLSPASLSEGCYGDSSPSCSTLSAETNNEDHVLTQEHSRHIGSQSVNVPLGCSPVSSVDTLYHDDYNVDDDSDSKLFMNGNDAIKSQTIRSLTTFRDHFRRRITLDARRQP